MMLRWIGEAERQRKAQEAAKRRELARKAVQAKRKSLREWLADLADGLLAVVAILFPVGL